MATVARLVNGALADADAAGVPAGWHCYRRFAEGAGEPGYGADGASGLDNRGHGALFLAQRVAVVPGRRYELTGELRTEAMAPAARAHLQLYFLDREDGALCSAPAAPHSTPLAGVVPWCGARVSARAPAAACAVEARVFVGGAPGCVLARNLALHELQEE